MVKIYKEFPGVEWVEGRGEFIKVNINKCIGCANCLNVCLAGCFEIVSKKAKIKTLENCMECGACWYVCEEGAIEFAWPAGGTGYKSDWG